MTRFSCCYLTGNIKTQAEKAKKGWNADKIFSAVEFVYKAIHKDICGECKNYYQNIEAEQMALIKLKNGDTEAFKNHLKNK